MSQGNNRIAFASLFQFPFTDFDFIKFAESEPAHFQSILAADQSLCGFMRRYPVRQNNDLVEFDSIEHTFQTVIMPLVHWVERSAVNSNVHLFLSLITGSFGFGLYSTAFEPMT